MMAGLLFAAFLMISPTCTEALPEMGVCYILDGILILYGIILTVLYCRLRIKVAGKSPDKKQCAGSGIYAGLTPHSADVYETINMDKTWQRDEGR